MTAPKQDLSLIEFAREQKRLKCKVCQVRDDLREEMAAARGKKGASQDITIMWLKSKGFEVSADDLQTHNAAHHERQLRELMANGR